MYNSSSSAWEDLRQGLICDAKRNAGHPGRHRVRHFRHVQDLVLDVSHHHMCMTSLDLYFKDVVDILHVDFEQADGRIHGDLVVQRVQELGAFETVRREAEYYADKLLGELEELEIIQCTREFRPNHSKAAFLGLQYSSTKNTTKRGPEAGHRTCWWWELCE